MSRFAKLRSNNRGSIEPSGKRQRSSVDASHNNGEPKILAGCRRKETPDLSSHALSQQSHIHSVIQIGLIFLALQLPALRALTKYFPHPDLSVPLFLALALCGTLVVMHPPRRLANVLRGPWPAMLMLAAFTVGTIAIYPYADGLKLQGAGSDSDDALILAGQALLRFQNPYSLETYLGNPIAPGPGWALLAAPFGASGLYPLFFPATLALALWCLRSLGHDWLTLNQFTLLLASSLCIWELAFTGSDYLPFVLLTLVVTQLLQKSDLRTLEVAGLILLAGLLATFRIVFFYLPLLVGFALSNIRPRRAVAIAFGSLSLCLAFQVGFFLLNRTSYAPLELLQSKTEATFSPATLGIAMAICAVTGIAMLVNWRSWRPITHLSLGLAVPWAIIAAADLARVNSSLPDWGGASYLALPLPFVVLALITGDGSFGEDDGQQKRLAMQKGGTTRELTKTLMKTWRPSGFVAFYNQRPGTKPEMRTSSARPPGCSGHPDFTRWIEYGKNRQLLQENLVGIAPNTNQRFKFCRRSFGPFALVR